MSESTGGPGRRLLIATDRVGLATPTRAHLAAYWQWETHPRTILGFGSQHPQPWSVREAGADAQDRAENLWRFEVATVHDGRLGDPIGMTSLWVDPAVRTAEYTIVMAPDTPGYGVDATRLTLHWAFLLGALHTVWLKVLEPNTPAVRVYEKAGFAHTGRIRGAGFWRGNRCDELIMDTLAAEWDGDGDIITGI
jgi:RimJ/RimL family protein N-acetyltransferase